MESVKMVAIVVSFCVASILKLFYLFLQTKREGGKIRAKQVMISLLGSGMIVVIAYVLGQFLKGLQLTGPFNGGFILSVVIPAFILLWYKNKPEFFRKRQKQAMMLLCYLLILILITPILGS